MPPSPPEELEPEVEPEDELELEPDEPELELEVPLDDALLEEGDSLFAALSRHDFAGFAESQLEERRSAGFPPFVFEAALRAEAARLETAMRFLRGAAGLAEPPDGVQLYDPVPHLLTRRAGLERAQLLIQSRSRPALQAYLGALSARLFEQAARDVRWHLDVDPIEFD